MTDSRFQSPCHPEIVLYKDGYGLLQCAGCGRAYNDPDDQTVTDGKNQRSNR